jgi:uncharacterized protein
VVPGIRPGTTLDAFVILSQPSKEKQKEVQVGEKAKLLKETIVYFEEPGQQNTQDTLDLALERARARGIKKMVLASTRGETAILAAGLLAGTGIKMVVVPHQYGFLRDGQRFPEELIPVLEKQGHRVYFGTMLFHTDDFYGSRVPSMLAMVLRTFCQGMKVVHEILLMAANGGGGAAGGKGVAIPGTGRGADTAVVAIAAPSTRLHELHITEIICKPLETQSWSLAGGPAPSQAEAKRTDQGKP